MEGVEGGGLLTGFQAGTKPGGSSGKHLTSRAQKQALRVEASSWLGGE